MTRIVTMVSILIGCLWLLPSVADARICSTAKTVCQKDADCPSGETCIGENNDYCVVPPFIQETIKPNLLLLIDNSASMYDLQYQDTGTKFCANRPTTACTTDSNCTGFAATCLASYTSTTETTTSPKACTVNADCPLSTSTSTPKPCSSDADCNGIKNDCNKGQGECKTVTITIQPCNNGFCRTDTVTTTSTTNTPISCTTDATCNAVTAGDTCNNKCNATRQCYDTTYNTATIYYGYFDSTTTYKYDFTSGKFAGGATMPGSCTYAAGTTKYLCVNTTGTGDAETVINGDTGFVAKGNFLNWLTTSKFDLQKKILTGGKYDVADLIKIGETRGCGGREFIKSIPGVSLSFAIRGGTAGGISATQSQATEYGQTYIVLYAGTYNADDCLAAMDNWMTLTTNPVNLGTFQNNTKNCVGAGNSQYNAVNMWNHILHNCYNGVVDKAQGYSTNLNALEGECVRAYDSGVAPASITDINSGIAICSSSLTYASLNGYSQGYLGVCYNSVSKTFDGTCALKQMENFCKLNVTTSPVVDPSSTTLPASAVSAPGFILAQGLMNMTKVGSFPVKIASATAPTGLINEFQNNISFGAMSFNTDGAASECGVAGTNIPCNKYCSVTTNRVCYRTSDCPVTNGVQETCENISNKDGSKVISHVGEGVCSTTTATVCKKDSDCPNNEFCNTVGTHASGLIKALGDLQATTWTPHAEAMYNAIAYYVKDATATNSALSTTLFTPKDSAIKEPLTSTDSYTNKNPIRYHCQKNNILIISDGSSTADKNSTMTGTVTDASALYRDPTTTTEASSCGSYAGTPYLHDLSYYAYHKNIFDPSKTCPGPDCRSSQHLKTFVVYTGETTTSTDICHPYVQMNKTAQNGGTVLYSAVDPASLSASLRDAFLAVSGGTASGTAASILSNSEGSGANILQAVFYPYKEFENKTNATWIGEMQNLWYYVDPFIGNSSVREDTDYGGTGSHQLDVTKDYVVNFIFDQENNETKAKLYKDSNGDGSGETLVTSAMDTRVKPEAPGVVNADDVKSIWRAGKLLWARDISASPRKLYTQLKDTTVSGCTGSFSTSGLVDLVSFNWAADATNSCILQKLLNASTQDEAINIIKYAHGYDHVDYYGASDPLKTSAINGTIDGAVPRKRMVSIGGVTKVWKLGDIISSTPRVQSSNKLNNYHQDPPVGYGDATYASDSTGKGFANSDSYKNRGMVYTGANDGMLHAFKMGKLTVQTTGDVKGTLSGDNLGKEEWAFVPKDVLPYLKFLASPGYSHVYLMDGPSRIVDASIGTATLSGTGAYATAGCGADSNVDGVTVPNYWACQRDSAQTDNKSWRTVLISSMGVGGASSNTDATCSNSTDCVKTPVSGAGFSTYYALDITDPANPSFMWEFKHDDLGYSTTGAAVVRVAHKLATGEYDTNGRWFAVVGNGPTGAINTTTHQFTGVSTKDLALFVLDLRNGALLKKLAPSAAVTNAFVGSIAPGAIDINRSQKTSSSFYSDDAVYVGYTQCTANCTTAVPTWDGGILRLITKVTDDTSHSTYLNSVYPKDWNLSILASGTGPITAAIGKLQDRKNKNLWLYAGAGRYFFKDDDKASQGKLLGIKDPCYEMDAAFGKSKFKNYGDTCYTAISFNDTNLLPQTTLDTDAASKMASKKGWYITLGAQDTTNDYGAERIITDPVAMPNGAVFFTSFMPSTDVCNFGGKSYMWGVQYDTGGVASTNALKGKALVQVSTGSFEELDLSKIFKASDGTIGRKMVTPMVGKPPTDPPPIVSASGNKALKRIIHVQEK